MSSLFKLASLLTRRKDTRNREKIKKQFLKFAEISTKMLLNRFIEKDSFNITVFSHLVSKFPMIGNFRKLSETSGNFRKLSEIIRNFRKQLSETYLETSSWETFGNFQKLSQIIGNLMETFGNFEIKNFQKLSETFGNFR